MSVASERVLWSAFPAALLVCVFALVMGCCLLALIDARSRAQDPLVALLLGVVVTQVVLFAGAMAELNVLLGGGGCVVLCGALLRATRQKKPLSRLRLDLPGASSLALGLLLTTLWSRQNLSGLSLSPETVVSAPWLDTFYHSTFIAHFAHASGAALRIDPLLQGSALPLYHYAGYMIPSLLVRLSGGTAYAAAVAVFAPLGLLCAALGAYSFGRLVVGARAGALALVACLALPDATFYFVENRYLSYFFFQAIAASGAFGVGLFALAWAFCFKGIRERDPRWTVCALVAGACVALFKAQIFLGYSFSLLLFVALSWPRASLSKRVLLSSLAVGLLVVAVCVVLPALPRAPTFVLGTEGGLSNLSLALSRTPHTSGRWLAKLSEHPFSLVLTGCLLLPLLTFGALAPLALLLLGSRVVRSKLRYVAWFPIVVLLNYLLVAVGLQPNDHYGDSFELIQKTFVWPYLAMATWCGCAFSVWLSARPPSLQRTLWRVVVPLGVLVGCLWVRGASGHLMTAYVFQGSQAYTNMRFPRAFYDSATFLRNNTNPGATVQLASNDSTQAYLAFSERPSHVVYTAAGGITAHHRQRLAELLGVLEAENGAELAARARPLGLDYLVLPPGEHPKWTAEVRPVFERGGYRVYTL